MSLTKEAKVGRSAKVMLIFVMNVCVCIYFWDFKPWSKQVIAYEKQLKINSGSSASQSSAYWETPFQVSSLVLSLCDSRLVKNYGGSALAGVSVGWSIVRCTKRLQVPSRVRVGLALSH